MFAVKDEVVSALLEKLVGKALMHFAPWLFAVLVALGVLITVFKLSQAKTDRVIATLIMMPVGGICGGVLWAILSRSFEPVETLGGPNGPGIAAVAAAVIAAVATFVRYKKHAEPTKNR